MFGIIWSYQNTAVFFGIFGTLSGLIAFCIWSMYQDRKENNQKTN